MKTFSLNWKSSSDTSKQRKYRLNSPLHLKRNFMAAHLAPDLRGKYSTRSLSLREGDTVKVMKGEFAGLTGKVNRVELKKGTVYIDGAERIRKDGTKSFSPMRPSSLLLVDLSIEDKRRAASLARKSKSAVVAEKKTSAKSKQTKNVKG